MSLWDKVLQNEIWKQKWTLSRQLRRGAARVSRGWGETFINYLFFSVRGSDAEEFLRVNLRSLVYYYFIHYLRYFTLLLQLLPFLSLPLTFVLCNFLAKRSHFCRFKRVTNKDL